MARIAGLAITCIVIALILSACGGNHRPKNAFIARTACADVSVTDYGWRLGWGFGWQSTYVSYPPPGHMEPRWVYMYGYTYGETGSHIENQCSDIWETPLPGR